MTEIQPLTKFAQTASDVQPLTKFAQTASDVQHKKYKYFIDLEWIPLNSCDLKNVRTKINLSQIRRPEIVGIVNGYGGKVFEVSDPFLFYTTELDKYEYAVYEFDNVRVVKYRKFSSNDAFKMCIKSTVLNIKFLELLTISKEKVSISSIRKFNSNIFNDIEKPIFIRYDYNYVADLIGVNGQIHLSLGLTDHFILIGRKVTAMAMKHRRRR